MTDKEVIELVQAYVKLLKENERLNADIERAYEIIERMRNGL